MINQIQKFIIKINEDLIIIFKVFTKHLNTIKLK